MASRGRIQILDGDQFPGDSGMKSICVAYAICVLFLFWYGYEVLAQSNTSIVRSSEPQSIALAEKTIGLPDGQYDFDFEIGTWKTHLSRLVHPLSGSNTWVEYDGTTIVSKIWNGRANLV